MKKKIKNTKLGEQFWLMINFNFSYINLFFFQILVQINEMFKKLPPLCDISVPEGSKFTVCGDIHGQYYDLLNIFELNQLPSTDNPYVSFYIYKIVEIYYHNWPWPLFV